MTIEGRIVSGESKFVLNRQKAQVTDKIACPTDGNASTELSFKMLIIENGMFHRGIDIEDHTGKGADEGGVIEIDNMGTPLIAGGDMEWSRPIATKDGDLRLQIGIKRNGKVRVETPELNNPFQIESIIEFEHKA